MSALFARVHLDEDVSTLVAVLIRARGFTASTAQDADLLGGSDEDQLEYAASRGMILVTHNRADFEKLASEYMASGRHHSGIITAVRRSPYEIAARILHLLDRMTADEFDNLLLYI
ncbi:MAG: hypothetical protein AMXMBFR13_36520 [Phycisphaerae bacterium]